MNLSYGALVTHGNALMCRGIEPINGFQHRTRLPFWRSRFRVSAFDGDQEILLATHPGNWLKSLCDRGCLYLKYGLNSDLDNAPVVGAYTIRDNRDEVIAAYFPDKVEFYASAMQPVKPKWGFLITRVAVLLKPAQPTLPRGLEVSKAAIYQVLADYSEFEIRIRGEHPIFNFLPVLDMLNSTDTDWMSIRTRGVTINQIMPPQAYPTACAQVLTACLAAVFPGGSGTDLVRYGSDAADNEQSQLSHRIYQARDQCFPDMINHLLLSAAQGPAGFAP
jgi:hypothetical protein